MTDTNSTVPHLEWGERPHHLTCAGCDAKPLCGFTNAERTLFYGACCYDDGTPDAWLADKPCPPSRRKPFFRENETTERPRRDPRSAFVFGRGDW